MPLYFGHNTKIGSMVRRFFVVLIAISFHFSLQGQGVIGKWKTVDDKTGIAKSIIEITEANGLYKAHVIELLDPEYAGTNPVCELCKGDKKNKPILGLEIMWNLEKDSSKKWSGGKILDPENGKTYGCKLSLEDEDTLKVRGYLGFAALGRNQFWYRQI